MIAGILKQFLIEGPGITIEDLGNGLINKTWLVKNGAKKYVLQKINLHVFKDPHLIDNNIQLIANYLQLHHPEYLFTTPIVAVNNKTLIAADDETYYRLFNFIEDSHVFQVVESETLAYEASKQFGKFSRLLSAFDISGLSITLPHFHDLSLRYKQFKDAISNATTERLSIAHPYINDLENYKHIVAAYENIVRDDNYKLRVMHHDTKISNVLFTADKKGLCVIDLDTVMPGYFISDTGDMMRTYLSPVDEEETDLSKIKIREAYFEAVVKGYLSEMQYELTKAEINSFIYAGKFMMYMQALRFITDYLNNDIYYGAKYPLHNLNRAINQLTLLNNFVAKESLLQKIVKACLLQKNE
ncbi:phosphotransferase [soil metagenome]